MRLLILITMACLLASAGCRGPAENRSPLKLRITPELLDRDWPEGPRREAAQEQIRNQSQNFVKRLFAKEAMPTSVPTPVQLKRGFEKQPLLKRRSTAPAWSNGIAKPPRTEGHDLPRPWPIQVRQGENIRRLARWAGMTQKKLLADNQSTLGRRRWLRAGDRLTITMSTNQKVAFDQARENLGRERLDNFFATRYVAKVIVYRVNRKERLSDAIRRLGSVPTWLLQEFNQRSFRKLRNGDEVLIPVVKSYDRAQGLPPKLRVVDADGAPLQGTQLDKITDRMSKDVLGRARLAIDDSNVFERRGGGAFRGVSRMHLPNYGQLSPAQPSLPAQGRAPRATPQVHAPVPAVAPAKPKALRQVIVKSRETLGHYAKWSGLSVPAIIRANPGLNPDRIFIGTRVKLPLGDDAYAAFVLARANRGKKVKKKAPVAVDTPPAPVAMKRLSPLGNENRRAPVISRPGRPVVADAKKPTTGTPPKLAITRSPAQPTPVKPAVKKVFRTVKSGDTASGIAVQCKTSLAAVRRLNPGKNLSRLRIGQKLRCK